MPHTLLAPGGTTFTPRGGGDGSYLDTSKRASSLDIFLPEPELVWRPATKALPRPFDPPAAILSSCLRNAGPSWLLASYSIYSFNGSFTHSVLSKGNWQEVKAQVLKMNSVAGGEYALVGAAGGGSDAAK